MGLNIKNERVHALAREAAARTGRSQTSVIEEALRLLLERLGDEDEHAARGKVQRIDVILQDIDARLSDQDREMLITDDLYDQSGLPE
ncbi:type II toxin-antitoxin system VapB family antitoxin [Hoyosella sp. YIM 151337]|nr:type II toxin-antitoxin system VapB family antitoxin [Hoyosella sp. YIM 151337]